MTLTKSGGGSVDINFPELDSVSIISGNRVITPSSGTYTISTSTASTHFNSMASYYVSTTPGYNTSELQGSVSNETFWFLAGRSSWRLSTRWWDNETVHQMNLNDTTKNGLLNLLNSGIATCTHPRYILRVKIPGMEAETIDTYFQIRITGVQNKKISDIQLLPGNGNIYFRTSGELTIGSLYIDRISTV